MHRRFLLFFAVVALAASEVRAEQPPPGAFGRQRETVSARLSPDGQTIAILGGSATARTLVFSGVDQSAAVLRLGDVETLHVNWIDSGRVVVRYAVWDKVGPRNAYRFERNIVVGKDAKVISYPLRGDGLAAYQVSQTVLGITRGASPRLMMRGLSVAPGADRDGNTKMQRRGGDGDLRVPVLLSVDPATGLGETVERGDFDIERWEVDLSGQARVMFKVDQLDGDSSLYARPKGSSNWTLIQKGDVEEYLGYSDPADSIFFARRTPAGVQVERRDLRTGASEPLGGVIAEGGDAWLKWDYHTDAVVGMGQGGDGGKVEWLDPLLGGIEQALGRAFPGKDIDLVSWSQDRNRFVVLAESADAPPAWFLYDRVRKDVSPIGEAYPDLANATLGRTSNISFKARDGLNIPAYLTLPPGGGAKPPLVVIPHGRGRDSAVSFDYLVHFLASRGYAVLRPQYRGSSGFGPALEAAGKGEWGGKIQSDIADGVAAVAASGAVDPARVCIIGTTTYGGFSALYGAVFQGDTFRCAASVGGTPDLGLLLGDHASRFGTQSRSYRALRDNLLAASPGRLEAVSPLRHAAQARAAVLLIHGEKDTSVPTSAPERMAEALKKAGKPVELVVLPEEGHVFAKSASRTVMLGLLEDFLAKHLKMTQAQARVD